MDTGERIAAARIAAGLTQDDLARLIGTSRRYHDRQGVFGNSALKNALYSGKRNKTIGFCCGYVKQKRGFDSRHPLQLLHKVKTLFNGRVFTSICGYVGFSYAEMRVYNARLRV